MSEIGPHQRESTVFRRRADSRPPGREPRLEETVVWSWVLSASERDRLVRLLASVPPRHRWALEHRHTPLLCAIGILDPPDEAYARAARRRFADLSETRKRVRALLIELKSETRPAPDPNRRPAWPRLWRSRVRVDPASSRRGLLVATPRSELLCHVLSCLGDHPHDDTIDRVTRRVGLVSADAVEAALTALEQERLVTRAGANWQLTHHGWAASAARDLDSG